MPRRRSRSRKRGRPSRSFRFPIARWSVSFVVVLAVIGSFFLGYQSGKVPRLARAGAPPPAASADADARASALDLLYQAYAARFEQRTDDAVDLLRRARDADPLLPGIDMAAAELAFDTRNFSDVRKFAGRARKGQYAGQANALLGLEKWLTRDSADFAAASLIDDVSRLFAAASEENYFDPLILFFCGDVLRESGQHDAGKRRAEEAQHRLQPWHSSLLISLQAALAADEAGLPPAATDSPLANIGAREAALGLRAALAKGAPDMGERIARLRGFLTAQQAALLLSDPALGSNLSVTAPFPLP